MKQKTLLSLLALALVVCGCTPKPTDDNSLTLNAWRLIGFGTANTAALDTATPSINECAECFTLMFYNEHSFSGRTAANTLNGTCAIDNAKTTLAFTHIESTEIAEIESGNRYADALLTVNSYAIEDATLKLYYTNDGSYLAFESVPIELSSLTLIGAWQSVTTEDVENGYQDSIQQFVRVDSLTPDQYGLQFKPWRDFHGHIDNGFCAMPPRAYLYNTGTWRRTDQTICVSIFMDYSMREYIWEIVTIDRDNLTLRFVETYLLPPNRTATGS